MPTLEIDLNCMCLFVPDPNQPDAGTGTVHVLMPCTHHAGAGDPHVVQMDYMDTRGAHRTVRLEGWGLELGNKDMPNARLSLALPGESPSTRIVDITEQTRGADHPDGRRVPRSMLTGRDHSVIARISFHGGMLMDIDSQWPDWMLGGSRIRMAHRLTWRMQVDDRALAWTPLNGPGEPPLPSLAEVKSVGDAQIQRLHVHHVAEKAFDPETGMPLSRELNEDDIRDHFRMFYMLLGEEPTEAQLPTLPPDVKELLAEPDYGGAKGWACKAAQAQPEF
jgi:hypothetical protein